MKGGRNVTAEEVRNEIKTAAGIIDRGDIITHKTLLMLGNGLMTAMMHYEGDQAEADRLWKQVLNKK